MPGQRQLFMLGSTHHKAPLEVRERLATQGSKQQHLLDQLNALDGLQECAIINTCNRVELYLVSDNGDTPCKAEALFCQIHDIRREEFQQFRTLLFNAQAIEHLFAVAAGLDSQMVGETEILGQVKQAYQHASSQNMPGPWLHKVFQKSFQVAKWVRTHTGISRGQVSIGNIAVELAQRIFGSLQESRVLLLGSGDVAEKTAQALASRGVRGITISSRTHGNAQRLAQEIGAQAIPFVAFPQAMPEYDIIIGSTSSPAAIVDVETVRKLMRKRSRRPLFLIDLALPRDFAPAAADLPDVFLYNLDDLSTIANENLKARLAEVEKGQRHAAEKAQALWKQIAGL